MSEQNSASSKIGGENAQFGDVNTRDTAGRDIYQGISGESLIKLVLHQLDKEAQFRSLLVNAFEKQHNAIMSELRILRLIIASSVIGIIVLLIIILV